jgi:hypothetical protein
VLSVARQQRIGVDAPLARAQFAVALRQPVGALASAESVTIMIDAQPDLATAQFGLLTGEADQGTQALGVAGELAFAASAADCQRHGHGSDRKNDRDDEDFDQAEACGRSGIGNRTAQAGVRSDRRSRRGG